MTKRLAFLLAVALGACTGTGTGTAQVQYASGVTVRSPELVTVDTDVYTLADSDEPVFYTDNSYWLYRDNRWYRSNNYDRGWVYVSNPSPRVRRIQSPTAYIRYRSNHQEARTVPRTVPYDDRRDYRGGRDRDGRYDRDRDDDHDRHDDRDDRDDDRDDRRRDRRDRRDD